MRKSWPILLGLAVMFALVLAVRADEEKTLKGTITCAKCDLKKADKCHTVIKVKEGDEEVVYWFDDASSKKNHGKICQEPKEGTVTGTVSKKGDKHIVKASKVEFNE
jgi:Family of unknown function (DUF6370)